jgi:hypothetical protein
VIGLPMTDARAALLVEPGLNGLEQSYVRGSGRYDRDVYTYVGNDPLDKTDPSGNCDSGPTCAQERDERAVLAGKMTSDEFRSNINARAAGTVIGGTVVAVGVGGAAVIGATSEAAAGTSAATTAVNAANGAAQAVTAAGTTTTSGAAAAGLATTEGGVFTGVSTGAGGAGAAGNATVQGLADAVPQIARTPFTGHCAECSAISNALNAGAKVEGSTMAAVRIATGKIMQACDACKFIAEKLGITIVPKP